MATPIQPLPAGYLWEVPGAAIAVHLDFSVIDDLLPEIMRGFAAVPKRGAEVGGILIGSLDQAPEAGQPALVRVHAFELVSCLYARGPSYLLTGEDQAAFEQTCQRWRPDPTRESFAVGYFRSHTRAGFSLSPEDIELLNRHFPNACDIALLIRPYASRPAEAGFFLRDPREFQQASPLVFPFSRLPSLPPAETSAEPSAPSTRRGRHGGPRRFIPLPEEESTAALGANDEKESEPPAPAEENVSQTRARRWPWWWAPAAILLLALGGAAGFVASRILPHSALAGGEDFSLALHVIPQGNNLAIRWDPTAPAIQDAQSGILEIEDGGYSKPVDLDSAHLRNGQIVYSSTSPSVRFRLIVNEGARVSVTQTVDWPH